MSEEETAKVSEEETVLAQEVEKLREVVQGGKRMQREKHEQAMRLAEEQNAAVIKLIEGLLPVAEAALRVWMTKTTADGSPMVKAAQVLTSKSSEK